MKKNKKNAIINIRLKFIKIFSMKDLFNQIKSFFPNIRQNKSKPKISNLSISNKEKINLLDQFANLLHAGIPILNAIQIIIYQTKNQKVKKLLEDIKENINTGISLKESLWKYKNIFWTFDLAIIEMWEITGKLWDAISTIYTKEEKSRELKGKIIWALIYPIVIICLSMAMIIVFMVYVIPKIQSMYADAKVNLPSLTQNIIDISIFLQNHILSLIFWITCTIILLWFLKKHHNTKIYFDYALLKIPLFWNLIKKKILSLFTANLSVLLQNGVLINQSLQISSHALENDYYEKTLSYINKEVSKWVELSSLMGINEIQSGKENFLFPIELSSIVRIWEETWNLSELLGKISIKFNKEIDEIIKNMQTAIEPAVIVIVGWIIGTIIMAIMLPFFNMVNVI